MFTVVLFRASYVFDSTKLTAWTWPSYIYLSISTLFITVLFKSTGSWKPYFCICVSLYMNIHGGDWFVNVGVNAFVDQQIVLQLHEYMVKVKMII